MEASWIGDILRRNCLLKQVTEERLEVAVRRGGRRKQLQYDRNANRRYCKLKEEALNVVNLQNMLWKKLLTYNKAEYVAAAAVVVVVYTYKKRSNLLVLTSHSQSKTRCIFPAHGKREMYTEINFVTTPNLHI
jgi:hypothetical protein